MQTIMQWLAGNTFILLFFVVAAAVLACVLLVLWALFA